jgi:hypothetical protein
VQRFLPAGAKSGSYFDQEQVRGWKNRAALHIWRSKSTGREPVGLSRLDGTAQEA